MYPPSRPPSASQPVKPPRDAAAWLLAIDSSTERLALALCVGPRNLTREEEGGARASSRLLPLAAELLAEAGLTWAALDAIAFAAGPGAFTGLRSACASAQGLALGLGRPLLALDSLAIVAEDARAQGAAGPGCVAIDARMGEAYAGAYRWDEGGQRWALASAPALWSPEALAAQWRAQPPAWIAGSALAAFAELQAVSGGAQVFIQSRDRAAALGRLAHQAWRDGVLLDAADALPLYVRDKVALTTAERQALR